MPPSATRSSALVLGILLAPATAGAHSYWMEVTRRADGAHEVQLFIGEHLKTPERVELGDVARFERFGGALDAGRTIDLSMFLNPAKGPSAILPAAIRARVLFLDSTRREVVLPPEKFRTYLQQEGLTNIQKRIESSPPTQPVQEEYFRCAKALLPPASGETPNSGAATLVVGQELEIVPVRDPFATAARAPVRFRVLRNGAPLLGATAFSAVRVQEQVTVAALSTNDRGEFELPRPVRGDWLLSVVFMEPSTTPGFDYRSVWASLWIPL